MLLYICGAYVCASMRVNVWGEVGIGGGGVYASVRVNYFVRLRLEPV